MLPDLLPSVHFLPRFPHSSFLHPFLGQTNFPPEILNRPSEYTTQWSPEVLETGPRVWSNSTMKGEKTATARKGLMDITNSQQPPPPNVPLTPTSKSSVEKLLQVDHGRFLPCIFLIDRDFSCFCEWWVSVRCYQENAALTKLIEEREYDPVTGYLFSLADWLMLRSSLIWVCSVFARKMVAVSGAALQKLRINCQKFQAQNSSLAKSNTQLLMVHFSSLCIDMILV